MIEPILTKFVNNFSNSITKIRIKDKDKLPVNEKVSLNEATQERPEILQAALKMLLHLFLKAVLDKMGSSEM